MIWIEATWLLEAFNGPVTGRDLGNRWAGPPGAQVLRPLSASVWWYAVLSQSTLFWAILWPSGKECNRED